MIEARREPIPAIHSIAFYAMSHLQNLPDQWQSASDQEIIHALFHPERFVNPEWMAYLKRNRPAVLATYLRLFAVDGNHLGQPAQRFLRKH